jgi:hypothetical protein
MAAVVEHRAPSIPPKSNAGFDGEDEPYAYLASLLEAGPDYLAWLEWLQRTARAGELHGDLIPQRPLARARAAAHSGSRVGPAMRGALCRSRL